MIITFYEPITGKIEGTVSSSDETLIADQIELKKVEGYNHIEGDWLDNYYIKDGVPLKIPEGNAYSVFNYTTGDLETDLITAKQVVLNIRNRYLQESDWTDTVSAQTRLGETLYNAWQDYRQQLRDIPQQQGFPLDVTFPTLPQQ